MKKNFHIHWEDKERAVVIMTAMVKINVPILQDLSHASEDTEALGGD